MFHLISFQFCAIQLLLRLLAATFSLLLFSLVDQLETVLVLVLFPVQPIELLHLVWFEAEFARVDLDSVTLLVALPELLLRRRFELAPITAEPDSTQAAVERGQQWRRAFTSYSCQEVFAMILLQEATATPTAFLLPIQSSK